MGYTHPSSWGTRPLTAQPRVPIIAPHVLHHCTPCAPHQSAQHALFSPQPALPFVSGYWVLHGAGQVVMGQLKCLIVPFNVFLLFIK